MIATGLVAAIVIIARFAWIYPAVYLQRLLGQRFRRNDPLPNWRAVFVVAFTGVRGAVSLAAALALPLALPSGEAFPHRDLILMVSFGVILITLVGLGLGLPALVRALGLTKDGHREHRRERESEITARRDALAAALSSLDAITDDRELSDEVVKILRMRHESRANLLPQQLDGDGHDEITATGAALVRELIAAERKFIHAQLRDGKITDEARRRIERDLDLEEASLANREFRTPS
jgi:CPA1 family monovalent cation:H+ antiporter